MSSSNSIVVTAPPEHVAAIESMITSLDGKPPADQPQVRTVFLKHARAERVAPIISELLAREEPISVNQLPSWARVNYVQMQMNRGEPTIRVAADTRLNAVVISALPSMLAVAEQMVLQLDIDPRGVSPESARHVRVMTVDNDIIPLPLKKGRNEIVVAVIENFGGWGLVAKWEDLEGIQ